MEQGSLESCENKRNGNVVLPDLPNCQLTPYRYHRCRVIPEEVENQENVDPQRMHQEDSDPTGHKSEGSNVDISSSNDASPFAYPFILEGCQKLSSSSPSYKSPATISSFAREINSSIFESPKTHLPTSYGRPFPSGSHDDSSHPKQMKELESNSERFQNRLRSNNGRHFSNAGAMLARGIVVSSGHSSSSMSNSGSSSNYKCTVTPSKSVSTPSSSSDRSVFRTPSETYNSTNDSRVLTPQQRCISYQQIWNPFEVAADHLQLPTVSPNLLRQVSPAQKAYQNFRWSIDQLATLQPVNIETSPYNQAELQTDPDYENQAQAAIDQFFNRQPVVPSPWTGSNKSVSLLPMILASEKPDSCQPTPTSRTVSSQTELSLPMVLPEAVEEILKPFFTYTQDQVWQASNELEEGSNLNNTTLRRKLLFSQDELVNATPMCSPRGPASPGSSASSSPVAPLPLHDDDDEGLMWSNDIVHPAFSNHLDPSQRRFSPPTPTFSREHSSSQNVGANIHPSENYGGFHSPTDASSLISSPNVSPIQRRLSPDVSPIHQINEGSTPVLLCHSVSKPVSRPVITCYASSKSKRILSPSGAPLAHSKTRLSLSISSDVDKCSASSMSDVLFQMEAYHLRKENDSNKLNSPNHLDKVQGIGENYLHEGDDLHGKSVVKQSKNESDPSEDCGEIQDPSDSRVLMITSDSESIPRTHPLTKEDLPNVVWTEVNEKSPGHVHNNETMLGGVFSPRERNNVKFMNYERTVEEPSSSRAVQRTPTSSKAEKRSSGNSGHFSSSPIRDVLQSPLDMDTPSKKFSDSPPLSPILCRSVLVQSQTDQLRAPAHCEQGNQCSSNTLAQSTLLNVDMEVRSSQDGNMMDEVSQASMNPVNCKNFTGAQELSSICEMDTTDLQQSVEGNTSHDVDSQESGYQTGSMQTTNFSMTTFTSNSTMYNSASFQKDRHPSIFGNETHGLTSREKWMCGQLGLP